MEYAFEYDYDGAHNRTVKVVDGVPTYYTYNEANELLTETTGGETTYYHYDGRGNTVAKQEPSGTTYYAYNTENLMTRIDFAAGGSSYYEYDADSKRVSQRTAEGFRQFVYQGPDMLKLQLERDESEQTVAQYTMGSGLEAMHRDGESSFYHYNHLGTALALTGADEAVTDTYRHDAWGVLLASTGGTLNPHTYVGRERYYRMPEAQMYHLGFRDYAQGIGRFMTVDPLMHAPPDMSKASEADYVLHQPSAATSWRDVTRLRQMVLFLQASTAAFLASVRPEAYPRSHVYAQNAPSLLVDPDGLQAEGPSCEDTRDDELDTAAWWIQEERTKIGEWERRALDWCTEKCRDLFPPTPGDFPYNSCVYMCETGVSVAAEAWRHGKQAIYNVMIGLAWARYLACKACGPIRDELAEIIRDLELMLQELRGQLSQIAR